MWIVSDKSEIKMWASINLPEIKMTRNIEYMKIVPDPLKMQKTKLVLWGLCSFPPWWKTCLYQLHYIYSCQVLYLSCCTYLCSTASFSFHAKIIINQPPLDGGKVIKKINRYNQTCYVAPEEAKSSNFSNFKAKTKSCRFQHFISLKVIKVPVPSYHSTPPQQDALQQNNYNLNVVVQESFQRYHKCRTCCGRK